MSTTTADSSREEDGGVGGNGGGGGGDKRAKIKSLLFGFFKSRPTLDALMAKGILPKGISIYLSFIVHAWGGAVWCGVGEEW